MKITIPEHIGDITLGQFQDLELIDEDDRNYDRKKICIFTELEYNQLKGVSQKDYADILKQIDKALELTPEFTHTFKIGEQEFGFIPNLDKMTTGEFTDLSEWGVEVENLHRIMSVLFRPITNTDPFNNYKIEDYNGTGQYAELMRQTPLHIVNGSLFFFRNLATDLELSILRSTREARLKELKPLTTSKSGAGMQL